MSSVNHSVSAKLYSKALDLTEMEKPERLVVLNPTSFIKMR